MLLIVLVSCCRRRGGLSGKHERLYANGGVPVEGKIGSGGPATPSN